MPGRKGEKGLLLVGHEMVPHGSGLTGDCSMTQQMVPELRGCLNLRLPLLFLRYGTPDWAQGRRKDCASVGVLEDFSILLKTLSHYSKSVTFK